MLVIFLFILYLFCFYRVFLVTSILQVDFQKNFFKCTILPKPTVNNKFEFEYERIFHESICVQTPLITALANVYARPYLESGVL